MVQKKIKKYKPKKRPRAKVIKTETFSIKNFLSSISFLLIFAIIFIITNIKKNIISQTASRNSIFSNTIQKISITSDISEVKDLISYYIGKKFNVNTKEEIIKLIKDNYPYISDINLNYNPVLSKLTINLKAEQSIAYLKPLNKYLLETGKLCDLSKNNDFLIVECRKCIIDEKIIKILTNFKQTKQFPLNDCEIIINKNEVNLVCGNILIEWGDDKYFKTKIEKLRYVLNDAKNKLGDSFKVNMRYFSDGRIIVSKYKPTKN